MKKLLIAAAVVITAVVSQAATYTWQAKTSYVYLSGSSSTKASGTAYLFNAGTYSQQTLLTAFLAGQDLATIANANSVNISGGKAVAGTLANGQVAQSSKFDYAGVDPTDTPNTWSAYFATVIDDELYISSVQTATATAAVAGNDIKFASQKTASQLDAKSTETFSGAGWYAAVPEPTSGLLLLLGMTGLALRRRRA